jgi:hypothetical protein
MEAKLAPELPAAPEEASLDWRAPCIAERNRLRSLQTESLGNGGGTCRERS